MWWEANRKIIRDKLIRDKLKDKTIRDILTHFETEQEEKKEMNWRKQKNIMKD